MITEHSVTAIDPMVRLQYQMTRIIAFNDILGRRSVSPARLAVSRGSWATRSPRAVWIAGGAGADERAWSTRSAPVLRQEIAPATLPT